MNTGFLGPAVATVLTACGIETANNSASFFVKVMLQQYLPLAVLKQASPVYYKIYLSCNSTYRLRY